ncbi:MAG: leucine-rich repeat domain-containing protein [Clostridia bacterium]|nr:leucine-rich repeat domain-containing protein [Clostridia bacterium]
MGIGTYTGKDLVIPETYEGKPVTAVAPAAFFQCETFTSLSLPKTVTEIGSGAFYGCTGLVSLNVDKKNPKYVSENNCLIDKTENALILGTNASSKPKKNTVLSIAPGAFYGCADLVSFSVPETVTEIGASAFKNCRKLKEAPLPAGLTALGASAFSGCASLTAVTIPEQITVLSEGTFAGCSSLSSLTGEERLTSLGDGVFRGCSSLSAFTLGSRAAFVGEGCFAETALRSMTVEAGNPFYAVREGCLVSLSGELLACFGDTVYTEGVTVIGQYAGFGMKGLTSLTLPEGITDVGDFAFAGATDLAALSLPASLRKVGFGAFYLTGGLTSVSYAGTTVQWDALEGASDAMFADGTVIVCRDGTVTYHRQ